MLNKIAFAIASLLTLLMFGACTNQKTYAPVVNAWQDPASMKSRYRVQKDDTIYSIAWSFDLDYRDLAKANDLSPPYRLKPGQTLTMCLQDQQSDAQPLENSGVETFALGNKTVQTEAFHEVDTSSAKSCSDKTSKLVNNSAIPCMDSVDLPEFSFKSRDSNEKSPCKTNINNEILIPSVTSPINQDRIFAQVNSGRWQWPVRGKILKTFSLQTGGCKGIDIAGNLGDPVKAVAPGKVVYSGNGLKGYGNLVIIKHSDNYLSAYAYNKKLLVKEGDLVKGGVEIAKMGQNDAGQVMLHLEIRRNGKPVNPLLYL